MKKKLRYITYCLAVLFMNACIGSAETQATKPSVLFLNVDDWNDWNEVLQGHSQAVTPHIKRLAERGVVFSKAICSSPTCFPSRTALMSGIHPSRSGAIVNDNGMHSWRFYVQDAVTLPKHLSDNGWKSIGVAKNFHRRDSSEFDTYFPRAKEPKSIKGRGIRLNASGTWGVAAVPATQMPDYLAVSRGIEQVNMIGEPLFLSLGVYRPHVPWVVPQEYFDRYPIDQLQLPERIADDLDDLPERFRLLAHLEAKFGKGYHDKLVEKGYDKQFVRAYLASVTFADEQVGRILDAWDASSHAKNGYIVLWSDHGYNLGEKEAWSKMKPWYDSAHCNLIIAGPGIQAGAVCDKAVSLQDLYPTLVDLLNIPSPPQQIDGNSLVPLLKKPNADWDKPVVMSSETDGIRYDVVLDNAYRMTRLITGETELYKLADDPHEFDNLAQRPEAIPIIARLSKHLTFSYPDLPVDGWIEAEETPRQTSSDYKLRGNCHFTRAQEGASGGQVICAELRAGKGSYIEFVVQVAQVGNYEVSVAASAEAAISVSTAAVVDDAEQADIGFPMKKLGAFGQSATGTVEVTHMGSLPIEKPGLHLLRFSSEVKKQQLLIDRIRLRRMDGIK